MKPFRALTAEDVECRVATVTEKGLSLLLYKNARVDMKMLDEAVGPTNWMRHHSRDNANCTISIWDEEKKQWIEKEDTGTESNTEAEKGLASDSFKRAGFNWGIGRELYTAPFIWLNSESCNIVEKNGKKTCYDRFAVTAMKVEDGKITALNVENAKTHKTVYTYGNLDEIPSDACCVCGKPVEKTMAVKSANKYGKVFCCGECKAKYDEGKN